MLLISVADIREWHITPLNRGDIPDSLIEKDLRKAMRDIDAQTGGNVETELTDATSLTPRIEAMREAMDKFCFAELLPTIATMLRAFGIPSTESDAGLTTNSYRSLAEIRVEQERWRAEARAAIQKYVPVVAPAVNARRSGSVPIEIQW